MIICVFNPAQVIVNRSSQAPATGKTAVPKPLATGQFI
jgi:hypothetical protein